ncbi:MAG: HAD-IA family hydrolase [Clostridiales bacterium]|nr:HAD-IA family hydrolase [Clostridiales bacterium]
MGKEYILFDLDGTISDPIIGITNGIQLALNHFNITSEREELKKFIGPPLKDTFMKYFNFSEEQCKTAIEIYRKYFKEKGMYENKLYNGIKEMLKALKDNGKVIALATSKPSVFAEEILKYFKIDEYFDFVGGSDLEGKLNNKEKVIKHVLENLKVEDLDSVIMVGDRKYDLIGASNLNIDTIGVLYGYGSREELEMYNPNYIAETVEMINEIILKND